MLNLVYKKYSIPKVGEFWIDFIAIYKWGT